MTWHIRFTVNGREFVLTCESAAGAENVFELIEEYAPDWRPMLERVIDEDAS